MTKIRVMPTSEILAGLNALEQEIQQGLKELEGMV